MRIKLLDIVFLLLALFVSAVFIFSFNSGKMPKKLLLVSGSDTITLPFVNKSYDLSKEFLDINYKKYNIGKDMLLEVVDGKARMTHSNCPDKICVNMDWAENCGDMVICMPNGVAVMVDCRGALNENQ